MPTVDYHTREVGLRFAAAGPVGAGKRTLLRQLHALLPPAERGELVVRTEGAPSRLGFDFTPAELLPLAGHRARATLFTFTDAPLDTAASARAYGDLDALLFVADSARARLGANESALRQLCALPALAEVPVVFLYNKRDLPDAIPLAELNARLNPLGSPFVAGMAMTGQGLDDVLAELVRAAFG